MKLWLPASLEAQGWEIAEQLELTRGLSVLAGSWEQLSRQKIIDMSENEWEKVLRASRQIRNSAVHRQRASAVELVDLLSGAIALTRVFQDEARTKQIWMVREQLKTSVDTIEKNCKVLSAKMASELEPIAKKRAELDQLEKHTIERILEDDKRRRFTVGYALEATLFESMTSSLDQSSITDIPKEGNSYPANEVFRQTESPRVTQGSGEGLKSLKHHYSEAEKDIIAHCLSPPPDHQHDNELNPNNLFS